MADRNMTMVIVGGGGGAPTIPEKPQGKPGIQDCAAECTGPLYKYMGANMTPEALRGGHNPGRQRGRPSKSKQIIAQNMREVFSNPPSTLGTDQTKEERRKQMVAIGLSKARATGARVPRKKG